MSRPIQRKVNRAYISYDPASDQSAILFKDRTLFPSGFRTTLRQGSKHALQIRDVLKNFASDHSSPGLVGAIAAGANSERIQEKLQEASNAERAEHLTQRAEHLARLFHEHRDDLSAGPSIFLGETMSPTRVYHVIGETSRWLDIFGEPGSGYSGLLSVLVRSQLYSRPGLMILDVSISHNLARVTLPGRQSLVLTIEQALNEVRCYQQEFDIKTRPIVLVSSPPHEPDDKNSMDYWNTLWKSSPDVVHMDHNTGVIAWDTWSRAAMGAFFSGSEPRFRSTLQYAPGHGRWLLDYSDASSRIATPTLNVEMMTLHGVNKEKSWCSPEDVPTASEQHLADWTAQEKMLLDGRSSTSLARLTIQNQAELLAGVNADYENFRERPTRELSIYLGLGHENGNPEVHGAQVFNFEKQWLEIVEDGSKLGGSGMGSLLRAQLYARRDLFALDVSVASNRARVILPGHEPMLRGDISSAIEEIAAYQMQTGTTERPLLIIDDLPPRIELGPMVNANMLWKALWRTNPAVVSPEHSRGVILWDAYTRRGARASVSSYDNEFPAPMTELDASVRVNVQRNEFWNGQLTRSNTDTHASELVAFPHRSMTAADGPVKRSKEEVDLWCSPSELPEEKFIIRRPLLKSADAPSPDDVVKFALPGATVGSKVAAKSPEAEAPVSLVFEAPEDLYRRFWEQDLPRGTVLLGATADGQSLTHDLTDLDGELRITGGASASKSVANQVVEQLLGDKIPVAIVDPVTSKTTFCIPGQDKREMELEAGLQYLQFLMSQVPKGKKADLALVWIDSDSDSGELAERTQNARAAVEAYRGRVSMVSLHLSEKPLDPAPRNLRAGVTALTAYEAPREVDRSAGIPGISWWEFKEGEDPTETTLVIPPKVPTS